MSPKARIPPPQADGYVVVRADGTIKGTRIYHRLGHAKAQARNDGDAVVPVTIDLGRMPLFIRGEKLEPT